MNLQDILWMLDEWLPCQAMCGHWVLHKKHIKFLEHRTGGMVSVCPTCYEREHKWNNLQPP